MIAYVNIRDFKVVEVWLPDEDGKFHPDLPAGEFPETPASMDIRAIEDGETIPEVGATVTDDGYAAPPGPDLATVIKSQRRALADKANSFIDTKTQVEGGGNRYDSGFKITALNLKIEYRAALAADGMTTEEEAAINAKLDRIGELETWVNAVMAEYQTKVASVLAATTIEEARAVALDLDKFMIGATGDGALPDPDVYLSEIS